MTDYSSDSSSASVESIASHAEESLLDLEEDLRKRDLEESLDNVMKHHDGTYRYPFNKFRNPMTAVDKGARGLATNEDVLRRLIGAEKKVWNALWTSEYVDVVSDVHLDADALDALIEVGFRAAGGIYGEKGIMYSVVCALLDARRDQSLPPRAPVI